jgi:hypothetical protein
LSILKLGAKKSLGVSDAVGKIHFTIYLRDHFFSLDAQRVFETHSQDAQAFTIHC